MDGHVKEIKANHDAFKQYLHRSLPKRRIPAHMQCLLSRHYWLCHLAGRGETNMPI